VSMTRAKKVRSRTIPILILKEYPTEKAIPKQTRLKIIPKFAGMLFSRKIFFIQSNAPASEVNSIDSFRYIKKKNFPNKSNSLSSEVNSIDSFRYIKKKNFPGKIFRNKIIHSISRGQELKRQKATSQANDYIHSPESRSEF
jgi:hypothetical protein